MESIKNLLRALHTDEDGATATEYIVLLVLVACFVIAVVAVFGDSINDLFGEANKEVSRISVKGLDGGD